MVLKILISYLSDAYDTAKMLCEQYYMTAPELKIGEFNCETVICFIVLNNISKLYFILIYLCLSILFHSLFLLAKAPKKPIQVVYVPSHLFHMLFELFKARKIDSWLI